MTKTHFAGVVAACAVAIALSGWSTAALAQVPELNFPAGVSGYDQALGVTVLTRRRPLYDAPGIQLDSINVRPNIDQSILYSTNPLDNSGPGSLISRTSGSIAATTMPGLGMLGVSAGVDHYHYFSLPIDYTDFNAGILGGYAIGGGELTAAYSHQSFNTLGAPLATTSSSAPALDQTDTARLGYDIRRYDLTITPMLAVSAYRFGAVTVLGAPVSQKFLDRNVIAGGVTTRFSMNEDGGLVVALRGISSHYLSPQQGTPSNNSTSAVALAGIDYQAAGVWRYQLLAGGELRTFEAAQYATRVAPTVEGSVIWTPTGVTTLTGVISRAINDPQSGGTNGYVLTSANLRADYELRRDVLLQGHSVVQIAQFLQGGHSSQNSVNVGLGATWLLNRNMRIGIQYDYTRQSGSGIPTATSINANAVRSGDFTQNVIGLTLHFGL